MRKEKFNEVLGVSKANYIEEARSKKPIWRIWQKRLVRLCIFVAICVVYETCRYSADVQKVNEYGIVSTENFGAVYHLMSDAEKADYGMSSGYVANKEDLGGLVGHVLNWEWGSYKGLNGFTVHRSAKYPEIDAIRVLKTRTGYHYIFCKTVDVNVRVGGNSNKLFSEYEIPKLLEKMKVHELKGDHVGVDMTDVGKSVIKILAGRRNIGLQEYDRRRADKWYEVYGNKKMYYDEEQEGLRIDSYLLSPVNHAAERSEVYDMAYALWEKDGKRIRFSTGRGFTFTIQYFPETRVFQYEDAYFDLTDEDVKELNELLQITDF